MKVIIAGSRWITDPRHLVKAIGDSGFQIAVVLSGTARGVDMLGEAWARSNRCPIMRFPAAWKNRDGEVDRKAGFKRNITMAEHADALIAVWDGRSPGTKHMIDTARKKGLKVFVHLVSFASGRRR